MPRARRQHDQPRFYHGLLGSLEGRYDRISFCTHPSLGDLRSFSWFHYHEPHLGQFDVRLRYTGWIDLTTSDGLDGYLCGVRSLRRRDYRRALRKGIIVASSLDIDSLARLYRLTFDRQGLEVTADQENRMRTITRAALEDGFGELLFCRDDHGTLASASLFLHETRSGYYLVGANHPDFRKSGSGTLTLVEGIRRCKARGLDRVDVCGMNSPNRGDFKASLDARPVSYFEVEWVRTS